MRTTPALALPILLLALAAPSADGFQVATSGRGGPLPGGAIPVPMAPTPVAPLPLGTGAISGVVSDAATRAPLADAVVYLSFEGRGIGLQTRQFTDAKGRFAFVNLPPGANYTVTVSKAGYLNGGYTRDMTPGGSAGSIVLREGEWMANARIDLSRPGSISGVIADERGEPIVGVYVRALAQLRIQGRAEWATGPMTTTDDRGAYRLAGLPPGRYVVQVPSIQATVPSTTVLPAAGGRGGAPPDAVFDATPTTRLVIGRFPLPPPAAGGVALAYPMTFFPGVMFVGQAGVIDLKHGEARAGADVRVEPVPTARITGTVEGPPDALSRLVLRLLPAGLEGLAQGSETATALVSTDGRFVFLNVPVGSYTIDAPLSVTEFTIAPTSGQGFSSRLPAPPGTPGWGSSSSMVEGAPPGTSSTTMTGAYRGSPSQFAARVPVVVGAAGETSVVVQLRPLGTLTGRLVIERDPAKAAPTIAIPRVSLEPANGSPALGLLRVQYGPEGAQENFTVEGLRAGAYCLRINAVGGWLIKSITWQGRDYTDQPFDAATAQEFVDVVVTVTNAAPVVTGMVRDGRGQPVANAAVIAFPTDRALWTNYGFTPTRLKSTRSSSTGEYRMSAVPAGDYYLVAVPAAQATAWQDPAFLEKAAGTAARISITWGGQKAQNLRIGAGG
jgi:hypothetical protein